MQGPHSSAQQTKGFALLTLGSQSHGTCFKLYLLSVLAPVLCLRSFGLFVCFGGDETDGLRIIAGVDGTKNILHIKVTNLLFHVLSMLLLHQLEVGN